MSAPDIIHPKLLIFDIKWLVWEATVRWTIRNVFKYKCRSYSTSATQVLRLWFLGCIQQDSSTQFGLPEVASNHKIVETKTTWTHGVQTCVYMQPWRQFIKYRDHLWSLSVLSCNGNTNRQNQNNKHEDCLKQHRVSYSTHELTTIPELYYRINRRLLFKINTFISTSPSYLNDFLVFNTRK